jgi:L-amino acid N-acyltransferase YncA
MNLLVAEDMEIRDAKAADLPEIVTIYNAAVTTRLSTAQLEPVTVEERKNWIKDHSPDRHPFWVTEIDRDIAGWMTIKPFLPRCAYSGTVELSVYVAERFRRRGVARALLEEVISRADRLEITAMVGLIFAHNEPSLRLFKELGFEKWGLLPRVALLDGVQRDLTIMGRHAP